MNSFHYRKNLASKAAFAVLLASVTLALPAYAQEVGPAPDIALPAADGKTPQKPVVVLPAGATIDGAKDKVRSMATEAGRSLDELIGSAVTPRTETEVGEIAARQRRIMVLEDQVREAKLAKELWVEVNGKDEQKNSEEIDRLQAEKTSLQAEIVRLTAAQIAKPAKDPDPVVSEVTGAAGSMKAKVLVPYMGEFMAERGTSLPNGMKVADISKNGVTVTDGGVRKVLAFGTVVPRNRPAVRAVAPAASSQADSSGNIMQQLGR